MTVSPRKRSLVVGRMRPSTKSAKDSPPKEWLAAESFQFTESPTLTRRGVARRSGRAKSPGNSNALTQQKRRQSVLLKRLDLPADVVRTSPNVRRTRRQSMGHLHKKQDASQEHVRPSKLPRAVSEKTVKNKSVNHLPPKPLPVKEEKSISVRKADNKGDVIISPQKFYSSPEKKGKMKRRTSFGMSTLEENLFKEINTEGKSGSSSLSKKGEKASQSKQSGKETKATKKKASQADMALGTSFSPVHLRSQKSSATKKAKISEASPSPATKIVKESRSTPAVNKVGNKESPGSALRKTKNVSIETSTPTAIKRLGNRTPNESPKIRLTRSAARSSQRVRLIGESPMPSTSAFRKTPKSTKKEVTISVNNIGSSPALSAKLRLQVIRCNSPLADKRKGAKSKQLFTPKPDTPPRNVLKQTMKKKLEKKLKTTTQVEIHRLMDEEICTPKTKISERPKPLPTPRTPITDSNLPPTPKSSRKSIGSFVSRRSAIRSTDIVPCPPASSPTSPRSSTPIEEDSSLDELTVDPVVSTFSQEEDDISVTESNTDTSVEQTKRSYCTVM